MYYARKLIAGALLVSVALSVGGCFHHNQAVYAAPLPPPVSKPLKQANGPNFGINEGGGRSRRALMRTQLGFSDPELCCQREDMSKPPREVIDALRANSGSLLRLLIAAFVRNGRPEDNELTQVLTNHPNLRNWLGTGESRILDAKQNQVTQREGSDKISAGQTTIKARRRRGRRGKRKKE